MESSLVHSRSETEIHNMLMPYSSRHPKPPIRYFGAKCPLLRAFLTFHSILMALESWHQQSLDGLRPKRVDQSVVQDDWRERLCLTTVQFSQSVSPYLQNIFNKIIFEIFSTKISSKYFQPASQ